MYDRIQLIIRLAEAVEECFGYLESFLWKRGRKKGKRKREREEEREREREAIGGNGMLDKFLGR